MKATDQTIPSISFLNNTHYNLDLFNNGGFNLSIEIELTPECEINFGGFRIPEQQTGLNRFVGEGSFILRSTVPPTQRINKFIGEESLK